MIKKIIGFQYVPIHYIYKKIEHECNDDYFFKELFNQEHFWNKVWVFFQI
jgi:hypothetical protein